MDNEQELPEGWEWTTLGEIRVDLSNGVNPMKTPHQIFELYSVPSFEFNIPEIISGSAIGSNKQTVETGTVLLSKINPRINRVWVVGKHSDYPKIASTEWIPFFRLEEIVPEYLRYYLTLYSVRDYLAANASGVGGSLMRINTHTLEDYPFPLAPLLEQQRIVSTLEEQFTRLDAAIASLQQDKTRLKQARASVLKAAVEGTLTEIWRAAHPDIEPAEELLEHILIERRDRWEADQLAKMQAKGITPKDDKWKERYEEPIPPSIEELSVLIEGWSWATVEQLSDVGTGATPLRGRSEYYKKGTIPWITSGALNSDTITHANEFITEKALEETNVTIFPIGTLFVAMYGEGKTRGKVSELKISATTNQACAALVFRPISNGCRLYVKIFMQNNYIEIRRLAAGGAQPNLNLDIVKKTVVPLPPLAEQQQIVAEVEARLSVITQAETVVETSLKRAERTRQSILQKAFSGQLVPQNPDDEPASVLLERIHAEREKRELEEQQRKKEERMNRPRVTRKTNSGKEQKPLVEVLREEQRPLSPADLFRKAELDQDDVEDDQSFHVELFDEVVVHESIRLVPTNAVEPRELLEATDQ